MSNLKKLKLASPIATALFIIMISATLLFIAKPGSGLAFVVKGSRCGLVITAAEGLTDISNLNPGDKKASYLDVGNSGKSPLNYFLDIQKTGSSAGAYKGRTGKHLPEILQVTIRREADQEPFFQGLIADFQKELALGSLAAGESERILVEVDLFGPEAGNEYQGASVALQFIFRAECKGGTEEGEVPTPPTRPGGSGTAVSPPLKPRLASPGNRGADEKEFKEQTTFTNNNTIHEKTAESWAAAAPGTRDTGETLPQTGETPPFYYYGLGLLFIVLGGLLLSKQPGKKYSRK